MKSVSQIMIEGDDIDMGSESDVSDTSQIRTSLYNLHIRIFFEKIQMFFLHPVKKLLVNLLFCEKNISFLHYYCDFKGQIMCK